MLKLHSLKLNKTSYQAEIFILTALNGKMNKYKVK